jgi:UDP:flavonoid glycosyltransferase YjiC (YdhE family)
MARIFLAWEFGGNFGHISGLAPIAAELCRRGHEVIAGLANIQDGPRFLPAEVHLLQAPRYQPAKPEKGRKAANSPQPHTYGDLMLMSGYEDIEQLSTLVRSWRALLQLIAPDLVLFESAPTATLAARGLSFVKVGFGSGYSLPPRVNPLPPMLPHLNLPFPELERRERALVGGVNEALAKNGIEPIKSMRDLFELDATLVKSVPELDQYGARSDVEYVGPSYSLDAGGAVEFPPGSGPCVFLYLRPIQASTTESVVQDLIRAPWRAIAVLPTATNEQLQRLHVPHVRASARPARLAKLVKTADLCVCHSAVGTGAAFLFAGVPLVLLPTNLEQEMSAKRVLELGAGVIPAPREPGGYGALIQRALANPSLRENAQKIAQRYGAEDETTRVRATCDRLERALQARA